MSEILRDTLANAIRHRVRLCLEPNALAHAGQGKPIALSGTEADAVIDAALAALAAQGYVIVSAKDLRVMLEEYWSGVCNPALTARPASRLTRALSGTAPQPNPAPLLATTRKAPATSRPSSTTSLAESLAACPPSPPPKTVSEDLMPDSSLPAEAPKRIQRHRTKGWRKPDNCVIVTCPSRFGNPFTIAKAINIGFANTPDEARKICATAFRSWVGGSDTWWRGPESEAALKRLLAELPELRGKDLACYCPLPAEGEPDHCHARILLDIANGEWPANA
ncbi:DUF4326 domain-containing protein (plasmid) [Streptosporangium sp. CA-135522]|uniref:DUF4326 domain-containing protein n=1 Tax=Streptosporangium sp. CA-135522 TaxID=3240072 RepID=UPI003D8CCC44